MTEEERLIERLRLVEALFAGAGTPGERDAAGFARERIRSRLESLRQSDPPIEYTFTLRNSWSKKLFVALLRRYDIKPYRYYRQRYTTVMARVPASFVQETLWPEFTELDKTLQKFLSEVTDRVIAETIEADNSDVEVREQTGLPPANGPVLEDNH